MSSTLHYHPDAARKLISDDAWNGLESALLKARQEVFDDVQLLDSGSPVPAEKQPLDSGFIELPARLLAEYNENPAGSLIGRIEEVADKLRKDIDRLVLLGIGGSYMGARALFESLRDPYHNELTRDERVGIPRIYFEGNNLDSDSVSSLLQLLRHRCHDPRDVLHRWGICVISKSGGTLETAVAFRVFRDALELFYGPESDESRYLVVPITGESGKLRELCRTRGYPEQQTFPIPDGVGGRFSVFTAVGLFPAAMLGLNVPALLRGAVDMTERFRTEGYGNNPVLDYTAVCHLLERDHGMNMRVLATWGKRLESLGLWYDQLLAESLGKSERGATPLTVVNTRDLHSRGQQHQEGARDKVITNVIAGAPIAPPVPLPIAPAELDQDDLNRYHGRNYADFLSAALQGTNQAYAEVNRPTADIVVPRLDEYAMGQLLQMFMLATVLEGRLIGINPYGQPGVEAYKKNMATILGADV